MFINCHVLLFSQLLKEVAVDAGYNGLVILISPFNRPPYDSARVSRERPQNGFLPLRDFVTIDHPTHKDIIDNKLMDMVRAWPGKVSDTAHAALYG